MTAYRLTGSRSSRWTFLTQRICGARSLRRCGEHRPEHAVEAVFDPRRLVARDPKSRIGEAIRVLGYSAGMDRVLVVVLVPDSPPPSGLWHVATAWPADSRMCRVYGGEESEDG
jgi:hypothetical protein